MNDSAAGENYGQSTEDFIEKLCTNSFFADFTIRSPKYFKKDGQEREAADLLVLFRDTLLVIQVKTKQLGVEDADELTDIDLARFTKTIDRTIGQFRALLEAWNDPSFGGFTNGRREKTYLKKDEIKHVILLAIYAALDENGKLVPINLRCTESCLADEAIPMHLFSVAEFQMLLGLTGTFSDFYHYLDTRAYLHRKRLLAKTANPVELWAFITFEPDLLMKALNTGTYIEVDGMMEKHHDAVLQLEAREQSSYFIDELIEQLHQGIKEGLEEHEVLVDSTYQLEIPGSHKAYQLAIPYLARLTRSERGRLTDELLERVRRSQKRELSSGGIKFPAHDEAYLVMSQPGPRKERQRSMFNLARVLMRECKCTKVVCLATGPEGPMHAGCDVMLVQRDHMDDDQSLQ